MHRYLLPLLVLTLLPFSAIADRGRDHDRARELSERGDILPLQMLLERVIGEKKWRVLEVDLEEERGRLIYELELLDERGRVHEIEVDARSGELLKEEIE